MMERNESGFTLIEMLIVMAVLATMLSAVWAASDMVGTTVVSSSKNAEVTTRTRTTLQSVGEFSRPGKMTTIKVQAVQADILAGRASTIGQWIDPTDGVSTPGIQFVHAQVSGPGVLNAGLANTVRMATFALESTETLNGVDDDGDGLVDEGELVFFEGGIRRSVVRKLEEVSFTMQGRLVTVRVRSAGADERGTVYRAQMDHAFFMRNN